jgi:undecaprenyl-diphosphatase
MQIPVTSIDRKVARLATNCSCEPLERSLQFVTTIADEKVLVTASFFGWIIEALRNKRPNRYGHLLTTLIVATAFDHLSKHLFDQERPDRVGKRYRKRGIPRNSGRYDSFPSGHAMRLGAAARALQRAHPEATMLIWSATGLIASSRVFLLAHWLSDVLAGTTAGIAVEEIVYRLDTAARASKD